MTNELLFITILMIGAGIEAHLYGMEEKNYKSAFFHFISAALGILAVINLL